MIRTLTLAALVAVGSFAGPAAEGHGHHHLPPYMVCHRYGVEHHPVTVDRMIACWAPHARISTQGILCIGDHESGDRSHAANGSNLGVFQESAFGMMWQFFKTGVSPYTGRKIAPSHDGRWVRARPGPYNARAQVLAEPYWMHYFGTGRWSTAGRCGM